MTQPAKTFKDLIVWQKAHQFVPDVYKFTEKFPKSELFGLTSQFRRAAISIAANVAEGFKKRSEAEKLRFVGISQGSLEECRYYLILSEDLEYGVSSTLAYGLEDVSRLLCAYAQAITRSGKRQA
jgi:four helix bundle protein